MQAGLDLILAIDRVRRGQERAIGLAAEHIIARRSTDLVGRVRLAAGEFSLRQRTFETFDIRFHPRRTIRLVEHVGTLGRSEGHTFELQSLMRISYAVFCLKQQKSITCTT